MRTKLMPVFTAAGLIIMVADAPEWTPTPVIVTGALIVCWWIDFSIINTVVVV